MQRKLSILNTANILLMYGVLQLEPQTAKQHTYQIQELSKYFGIIQLSREGKNELLSGRKINRNKISHNGI